MIRLDTKKISNDLLNTHNSTNKNNYNQMLPIPTQSWFARVKSLTTKAIF